MYAAAPSTASQQSDLRSRFAVVSGHLRALADHPRSAHPAAAIFRQQTTEVVTLLKAVYPQLPSATTGTGTARSAASARNFQPAVETADQCSQRLYQAEQLLQNIWWQFGRLDWLEDCGFQLRDFLDRMQRQASIPPDALQSLIRHILTNVRQVEGPELLLTEAASPLEQWLPVRRRRTESAVLAAGVETAVLTAWVALHFREWELDCESLIAAALLQDIGLLNLEHRFPLSPQELQQQHPRIYRKHPEYSAALAAGIQGLSSRVPLAVAAHHEPAGGLSSMTDRTLNPPEARWLQVIVRLRELRLDEAASSDTAEEPPAAVADMTAATSPAGQFGSSSLGARLAAAEPETLDPAITAAVLACFRLNNRGRQHRAACRLPVLTSFGEQRLRRDAAHAGLLEPHIPLPATMARQLNRQGRATARTSMGAGRPYSPDFSRPAARRTTTS